MPAIANIVIADSAPVNRGFSPSRQGLINGLSVAEYENRAANTGIPVGFHRIQMSMSRPSKDRKTYRLVLKVSTPVLEVVSNSTVSGIAPAPTVSYTPMCQIEFVIPDRSSPTVRADLRAFAANLLGHASVVSAVNDLDFPF